MSKQKHLTLDSRIMIETQLNQRNSFKGIAKLLGKDCTTISKEIKNHICFEKSGALGKAFNDCKLSHFHQCTIDKVCKICGLRSNRPCWTCGRCTQSCIFYEKYVCPNLLKPPYVCNGCSQRYKCILEKRYYKASLA